MSLQWGIVGGGIHGTHMAARLIHDQNVSPDRIVIVDPGPRLLDRWLRCTQVTGMSYLRSPSVHHLGVSPWCLRRFAGNAAKSDRAFAAPYQRPSLALFNSHCEHVISNYELRDLHVRDRVTRLTPNHNGVTLQLSMRDAIHADRVILAIGASEQPRWPHWADRTAKNVDHIFAMPHHTWPSSPRTIAVVGGGISAGQTALRLLDDGHRVYMISPHALTKHQFDSDPGWLGPKLMTRFSREKCYDRRRRIISRARYVGSMPRDVWAKVRRAVARGQIDWCQDEIVCVNSSKHRSYITLASNRGLEVDRILLATGFDTRCPGGDMIELAARDHNLKVANCGYPIIDASLRWHDRIHVMGPLAELELGPTARNIAGARRAADRISTPIRRS